MPDPDERPRDRDDLDEGGPSGPRAGTDDGTEADMGLVGGTGAAAGEGTAQPYGTEAESDEDEPEG